MRDELLWVYEGMTQYFGNVLTARAGLRTPEETRDVFARVAAGFEISPGREWRPLVDTTTSTDGLTMYSGNLGELAEA
jgi:predicted metalloprotease with PDZ domain